jgi:hypothetical protein
MSNCSFRGDSRPPARRYALIAVDFLKSQTGFDGVETVRPVFPLCFRTQADDIMLISPLFFFDAKHFAFLPFEYDIDR